jgi:hypothetical protein
MLIEMLHCPARSPLSFSRRLLGGINRSSTLIAALSIFNFRTAVAWISGGMYLDLSRRNSRSVSASAQLRITTLQHNAQRYVRQVGLDRLNAHSKLQAASRVCPGAARRLPPTNAKSAGEQCSRRDAVQFEPPKAARPPSQRIGGLAACEGCWAT